MLRVALLLSLSAIVACGTPEECNNGRRAPDMTPAALPDLARPECIPCAQSLPDMGEPMGCVPSLCVRTVSGALCCVGTGEGQ